jgi:hypothetical protein
LIDYGNEGPIKTKDLLMPNLLMKNLKAFAFQAEIVDDKKLNLTIGDKLNVNVLSRNDSTKIYQLKVFNENDTVHDNPDIFETAISIVDGTKKMQGVITILALPKKTLSLVLLATPQMKEVLRLLLNDLPEMCVGDPTTQCFENCASAEVGDIRCLKLLNEWQRVKVIQKYDDNYVLYLLDSGTFEFASEPKFKECNKMFAKIPATTIVMEIKSIVIDTMEFYRKYYTAGTEMKFCMTEFDEVTKEITCDLTDKCVTLATVTLRKFSESFEDLGKCFYIGTVFNNLKNLPFLLFLTVFCF